MIGSIDLKDLFWKEPFLKTDGERSALVKALIIKMSPEFLSFFQRSDGLTDMIVESLKKTDHVYTIINFEIWVDTLCKLNCDPGSHFRVFLNLCNSYSYANYDILVLLKNNSLAESLSVIREWYSCPTLVDSYVNFTSPMHLSLLRYFNNEDFYASIFRRFSDIATNERYVSFIEWNSILNALSELNLKEECFQLLFEKHPLLVLSMKKCFEENVLPCFTAHKSSHIIPLACHLTPNWMKLLAKKVEIQIREDDDLEMEYGREPLYYEVVKVFHVLEKHGLLADFLQQLTLDASEDLTSNIQTILERMEYRL